MNIDYKVLKLGLSYIVCQMFEDYFGKKYIKRDNSLKNKTSLITIERLINESINVEE